MSYNQTFTPSSKASLDSSNEIPIRFFSCEKDSETRFEVQPSSSNYFKFLLDRVGEGQSKTDQDAGSSKNDGEGTDEAQGTTSGKLPERILKLNQSSVSRPGIEGLDLDEYIRRQNIMAPPKHKKPKSFPYERTLASGKFSMMWKTDACISSHEDTNINRGQPGESTHGLQHQQHNAEAEGPTHAVQEKPETVCKALPENGPSLEQNTEEFYFPYHFLKYDDTPDWINNSWEFLSVMVNKGIPLFWEVLQRADLQDMTTNDQSRMFRCVVSFNHMVGVCEASNSVQAKHGAAWNFLEEFKKAIPSIAVARIGVFPDKFDDAVLIKESAFRTLSGRMNEIFGAPIFHNVYSFEQNVEGHTLFKCILHMAWAKFEGSSYINASVAHLLAVKAAFEKLVGEACPVDQIHLGPENCTAGGGSLYRIVESQRVHRPSP